MFTVVFYGYKGSFPGIKRPVLRQTAHHKLMPKLRDNFLLFCGNIVRPFGTEVAVFHISKITF